MKVTMAQLRQKQAARKRIERDAIKFAERSETAIENLVGLLQQIRTKLDNKSSQTDFVDVLDWYIECLFRQHSSYSRAITKFAKSLAQEQASR